ncbi:DUF6207 family protein [Streptomyces sp. NBC_01216]|uniref:DUF6207 family protein n=1 Tax=Streptomyces sp. NBC_01216 TaxID=2903778 RepID=UPI002E135CBE|nr:DUF6207 family protein [Streptomyces sp. NBC_01216]
MSTIDDLLARALLLDDVQVPRDTVAYEDTAYPPSTPEALPLAEGYGRDLADETAAAYLRSLCEVAVSRSTPGQLSDFITDQVPAPRGAWILGCLLELAGAGDSARFWWQYAAGAEDTAASYCLYLHHRALGDRQAAAFWHEQTDTTDTPANTASIEESIPTFLRILSRLTPTARRAHTEAARAVMEYVSAAVAAGYARHPEYEIPLPGPYFAEQIQIILAATSAAPHTPHDRQQQSATTLPNRPTADSPDHPDEECAAEPERVLVEIAASDDESASAFREAVAACWERATVDRTPRRTDRSGVRMRYYLDRRPLTKAPQPRTTQATEPAGSQTTR